MEISFVLWLLGAIGTLLGGCWAIFKYFESKINRVYERLDANKKQYYENFVTLKVYEAEREARRENIDQRFQSLVLLFNEKIESLRTEIRILVHSKNNHQGG